MVYEKASAYFAHQTTWSELDFPSMTQKQAIDKVVVHKQKAQQI